MFAPSTATGTAGTAALTPSTVIGTAGTAVRGEAGRGLGETWNRGRGFPGAGSVPGFPQCDPD
jgi:hypothetical protein